VIVTEGNAPITGTAVVEALVAEVGSWPGVEVAEHRFGGVEFRVGRREVGHVHAGGRGGSFADLPFPRAVRDELIAAGRARPHHVLPDSGWITVPISTAADLRSAIEIFRGNYDRTSPVDRSA
jgi:hypothetical protein